MIRGREERPPWVRSRDLKILNLMGEFGKVHLCDSLDDSTCNLVGPDTAYGAGVFLTLNNW